MTEQVIQHSSLPPNVSVDANYEAPLNFKVKDFVDTVVRKKKLVAKNIDKEYRQRFMDGEVFVIDATNFTQDKLDDFYSTVDDLVEMGLAIPPAENFSVIFYAAGPDIIFKKDLVLGYFYSCDLKKEAFTYWSTLGVHKSKLKDLEGEEGCARHVSRILLALLNTRGVVATRKIRSKAAQKLGIGKSGRGYITHIHVDQVLDEGTGIYQHVTGIKKRPHFRRGHIRRVVPEDRSTWIYVRPCFVNGAEGVGDRIAYDIKSRTPRAEGTEGATT